MSKHKNRHAVKNLNNDSLAISSSTNTQQQIDNENANSPGNTKKQVSGIWAIVLFFGLLFLVVFLGWLTK